MNEMKSTVFCSLSLSRVQRRKKEKIFVHFYKHVSFVEFLSLDFIC